MVEIEALKRRIREAFANAKYPGDEAIQDDDDPEEIDSKAFLGHHWRDITEEAIRANSAAVQFFSPACFAFYLPAYLIFALDHLHTRDYATEAAVTCLKPRKGRPVPNRFQLLSETQRTAIAAFLVFMRDSVKHMGLNMFAEEALSRYWERWRT